MVNKLKRIEEKGKDWKPKQQEGVCSKHFVTGNRSKDKTHRDYNTTQNLGYVTHCSTVVVRAIWGRENNSLTEAMEGEAEEAEIVDVPPSDQELASALSLIEQYKTEVASSMAVNYAQPSLTFTITTKTVLSSFDKHTKALCPIFVL